ncbi:MAG: TatD family deoxyribonuclease [Actinobacteria bacterium HGW-Actinobacteria-7]|nr:MAG: TatD family deoxyribonuclease [Actinobacteria bacterium HGW-Actinobacteria-7]
MPIADTHAHLDMLDDPALALARAALAGVGFVATVADVTEDAWRTYDELPSWLANARELLVAEGREDVAVPRVRVVVGAHPHNAKDWTQDTEAEFRRLAADSVTCAIGELGLDYHYDHSPRDVQREAMRAHLTLAHEFGLPAVVHLREAHADGLEILREVGRPPAGCILHCFNLAPEVMEPFLELGCHVSFAGPATFKKAEEVREAAQAVPEDRLLTETDCPFMAPEPFRGRTNEPAYVVFTAARLARARSEEPEPFARHTFAAALALLDAERR